MFAHAPEANTMKATLYGSTVVVSQSGGAERHKGRKAMPGAGNLTVAPYALGESDACFGGTGGALPKQSSVILQKHRSRAQDNDKVGTGKVGSGVYDSVSANAAYNSTMSVAAAMKKRNHGSGNILSFPARPHSPRLLLPLCLFHTRDVSPSMHASTKSTSSSTLTYNRTTPPRVARSKMSHRVTCTA